MRPKYWIIAGVVVVGGVVILASDHHPATVKAPTPTHHHVTPRQPKPKPKAKSVPSPVPIPKKAPTIPTSGSAPGAVIVSFTAVASESPPVPLQVVTLPWQPTTQWAIEPLGTAMHGNALKTLWFGEKTGSSPWHWIPTTLPGVPSSALPAPIQQSLKMAYSLHLGEPGPSGTVGNITWQALQDEVSTPSGWTLTTVSTNDSPLFQPTVALTVFQKSLTGSFTGYYGMEDAFDADNATHGLHGLVGFVSRQGNLSSIVGSPPPLL